MTIQNDATVTGIVWVVFLIYWFVAAVRTKRHIAGGRLGFALIRLGVMVLLLVLIAHVGKPGGFNFGDAVRIAYLRYVGLAVFALGIATAIWARVTIGANLGYADDQS